MKLVALLKRIEAQLFPAKSNHHLTDLERKGADALTQSLATTGVCYGCVDELPSHFAIDFDHAQLLFKQHRTDQAPAHYISARFAQVKSIALLNKQRVSRRVALSGYQELYESPTLVLPIQRDQFACCDPAFGQQLIQETNVIHVIKGCHPCSRRFSRARYQLVFWLGEQGFAVAADELSFITANGRLALDQLLPYHQDWWQYWDSYWKQKDTPNPMPVDYTCDVVIPS